MSIKHLGGISFVEGNVKVDVDMTRINDALDAAQAWLGNQILQDCKPYMPLATGSLQQRSYVENGGRLVVFPGPYARFLYMGKVMIGETSHSPWAKRGEKKIVTDRDLNLSPGVAMWFDAAKADHCEAWVDGVKQRINGEEGGNG